MLEPQLSISESERSRLWHLLEQMGPRSSTALGHRLESHGLPAEAVGPAENPQQEAWQARGIRLVSLLDGDYPPALRELNERPAALFVQGSLSGLKAPTVAIVGTRGATELGLRRAERLARSLVGHRVTVVSGLARGIDTAAHRAALQAGGTTVAVLGNGLGHCYPPENRALQREIAARGGLLSQFPPSFQATRYSFPMRNKVIAGVARVSVVVEAAEGSGAYQEALAALKFGRPLFLLRSLVEQESWARHWVEQSKARELVDVMQILEVLEQSS